MEVSIFKLSDQSKAPYDLLLLADPHKESIEKYLSNGTCFIVENDNEDVIGCYVLKSNSPIEVEIVNIAVEERYQGKGIGKQMLNHAIDYAHGCGYTKLAIGTANSSIYQLYLYQKIGFDIDRIEKDHYLHFYPDTLEENGIPTKHKILLTMDLNHS